MSNPARANSERTEFAQLEERAGWLSGINWKLGKHLKLVVEFDIQHNGEMFGLVMSYPSTFPDIPPEVRPKDARRLSGHQYGAGGELCLEYRPDNWCPFFTGAMMVESAYRLISGERPPENEGGIVPSAHQVSIGRDLRHETLRFMITQGAVDILAKIPVDVPLLITNWNNIVNRSWVASLVSLGEVNSFIWAESSPQPSNSSIVRGFVQRTSQGIERFKIDPMNFIDVLPVQFPKLEEQLVALEQELGNNFHCFILLGDDRLWVILYLFRYEGTRKAFCFKPIIVPESLGRLPTNYVSLVEKRVAIIGCGSVGSKVASMLARSGVRNFTLVDDDIFFPENLVRNDLDARAIGRHKVDALATRLKDLVGNADITCQYVALGQQESAGTTEAVMENLAKVDLLIDATADARAFNLVAAVARRHRKPMVWCEVFAGGIGGIIARARPNIDPAPISARDQIRAWCESQEIPWCGNSDGDYGAQFEDSSPQVADDADVGIIAGHAARLALDILTREQSIFPHSAYVIGLSREWIFSAPFDTYPISLLPDGKWGEPQDTASPEALKVLLASLSQKDTE